MEKKQTYDIEKMASVACVAASVILLFLLIGKFTGGGAVLTAAVNENAATSAEVKDQTDASNTIVTQGLAMAKSLKEGNHFFPPAPKPQGPRSVEGIMGNEVLIGGKWYKVGDTVLPGAKVVAIRVSDVTLEWEGREIVLAPIGSMSSGAASNASSGRPGREQFTGSRYPTQGPSERRRMRGGNMERGERPRRFNVTEEDRARFEQMSPDERREFFRNRRGGRQGR